MGGHVEVPASFRASVRPEDFSTEASVGERLVVTVQGEVDMLTAPLLWERVEETILAHEGALVLDLTGVRFMDSMGLGVMIRVQKRLREANRPLVVRSPSEPVRKVFAVTGLDRVFDFED